MNKIGKSLLIVALVTFAALFVANASFATVCNNLQVDRVGAKSGENAMFVTKTSTSSACPGVGSGIWVVFDSANSDAMLATALTALSLSTPVVIVNASGDFVNQGTIIEIYVAP